MSTRITRRTFVAQAAMVVSSIALPRRNTMLVGAAPTVRIGVVDLPTAKPTDPRGMGLILGAEEATHAAALFGGTLKLVAVPTSAIGSAGLSAIIGNADCARCDALSKDADAAGIAFFNIQCTAEALRGANCRRTMFHVAPSDAMRRDAVAAAHVDGNATVVAWQPTLVRFGADTLNRRFKARFGHPMTADAWTAWLATKILWESALRVNAGDPKMLIEYLSRETTQFDGHKGVPLSFRAWDRQLRQPLFVVNDNKSIEVPIAPASHDPPPARDLLDQLGTGAANSACHVRS